MSAAEFLEQTIGIRNRWRCVHSDKPGLGNIVRRLFLLSAICLTPLLEFMFGNEQRLESKWNKGFRHSCFDTKAHTDYILISTWFSWRIYWYRIGQPKEIACFWVSISEVSHKYCIVSELWQSKFVTQILPRKTPEPLKKDFEKRGYDKKVKSDSVLFMPYTFFPFSVLSVV